MNFKYFLDYIKKKITKSRQWFDTSLKKDVCLLMTPKDPLTDLSTLKKKFNIKTF